MLRHGAARHESAWACDALATDLAMTAMLTPLGREPDGDACYCQEVPEDPYCQ